MVNSEHRHDPSSQIFEMVEKNLPKEEPEQNSDENIQPLSEREFFLWMAGIVAFFFLLRYVFFLF